MDQKTAWTTCPNCKKSGDNQVLMASKNGVSQYKCSTCQRTWQVSVGGAFGMPSISAPAGAAVLDK